ncbi:MAG: hypothetical protein ACKOCD_09845 [Nitrospiraceae bacterium]
MSPLYKSGAFIQQCFASHRLCLSVKRLDPPEKVILSCSACRMLHRATVRTVTTRLSANAIEGDGSVDEALAQLGRCQADHPTALGIGEMDVVQDWVRVRCADCRRLYDLDVAVFETHQRE